MTRPRRTAGDARVPNATADAAPVASPCTSVCRMDASSGLCAGCLRTIDEIAAWSVMDDAARRDVLSAVDARRARVATRAVETPDAER